MLSGRNSLVKTGTFDLIVQSIQQQNIKVYAEKIEMEPNPSLIDTITGLYHKKNIDVVVAIGGGSVLDAGKAVSAMLPLNEPVKTYLEGVGTKKPSGQKIPFIAIPTTAGTGSETTKNAVISEIGNDGYKKSLRHDKYIPDIALIDPFLTINCPKEITAASGMDAFTQLLEAYLSDQCDEMTSSLIFSALKAINRSLVKTYKDGRDIVARTDMSYAAMISGIGLANAGLGVIHGFASPLGGYFKIPHGVVCGTLMAPCNKYTVNHLFETNKTNSLKKYQTIAGIFLNSPNPVLDDIKRFIEYLYLLTEDLKIPVLEKYGITENDFDKIINETSNKNNPVKLENQDLLNILSERL